MCRIIPQAYDASRQQRAEKPITVLEWGTATVVGVVVPGHYSGSVLEKNDVADSENTMCHDCIGIHFQFSVK